MFLTGSSFQRFGIPATVAAAAMVWNMGCGTPTDAGHADKATVRSAGPVEYLISEGDSLRIPGFTIQLQLSRQATAALAGNHETVIVHAWFNGQPKDTSTAEYHESGEMFLCEKKTELDTARTVVIDGLKISKKQFDALSDKDISVLVNVYSGRRAGPDNILNCDIIAEKMSRLKGQTVMLEGKLIAEAPDSTIKPGYTPSGRPLSTPPLAPTK